MLKTSNMVYKTLVVEVIILFVGISVVYSTGNIAEDYSLNKNFIESFNSPNDKLICEHLGYVLSSGTNYNIYEFLLNDPNNLTCVCEGEHFTYGATWSNNGYIYSSLYDIGLLLVIDLESCEMWSIGGGGANIIGLAYDHFSEKIYASSDNNYLYEIDPNTGEQEQIGPFGGGALYMVGIAFDSEGILYGWDLGTDSLWKIDIETGEATQLGPLGISITHICDGDFCKEDDILYIVYENNLLMFDKDKGECELNGQFPDYVSVTGLAIPYEDNEPPVTTISFDPPDPDGENGWYISDVNVTLNATDDMLGVNATYYRIDGGEWKIYTEPFTLSEDGDDILIQYYSVDNAGNVEDMKYSTVDIDQKGPEIELTYEFIGGNRWQGWDILLTVNAVDDMSGMVRVEFYYNDKLQETVNGSGPKYECEIKMYPTDFDFYSFFVRGLICNLEVTEEFVNFYSIVTFIRLKNWEGSPEMYAIAYDLAGNYKFDEIKNPCTSTNITPGFYLFQKLTLPNNYTGHIGRFYISATFDMS